MNLRAIQLLVLVTAVGVTAAARAQGPEPRVVKPSNSGVPGEEVRVVRWAPDGRLWVAARWPFWGEGGIGVWDPELATWSAWSNWDSPIPSQFVNDIEFDPEGVAWIATDGGLVRRDAESWTVYDTSNSPLAMDTVADVAIAPGGDIWINNSDTQLPGDAVWRFDGVATWNDFRVPDDLPWDGLTDLSHVFVSSNGHVWVGHGALGGVAEFDGASWVKHGAELGTMDEMAEDQFGNLWINGGTDGAAAYFRWDGEAFTTYPLSSPQTLTSDPEDGTVYVGNWQGEVQRTRDGGDTVETFLSGLNRVVDLAPDPAGEDVWIGTIGAVGQFGGDASWVRDFNSWNSGFPDYFVDRFALDADGYLWAASLESGLSRFDGARWRNWGDHNAGSEPYPFAGNDPMGTAFMDSSGQHWFGGNGIARWDDASGEFTGFWNWENNPGMGVGLWTFFAEDAAGRVFAVEEEGLTYRFDEVSQLWLQEPVLPGGPSDVPGMTSDGRGDVWLAGTFDVHRWDGESWTLLELPYPDYFLDLGGIASLDVGPDDTLWIGTLGGLVRYAGAEFTLFDGTGSPLPHDHVRSLDVRDDGALGLATVDFATLGGAAVLVDGDPADPASWSIWAYPGDGLPHWQLEGAGFDRDGDLWVSTAGEGAAVIPVGEEETLVLGAPTPAVSCVENRLVATAAEPGGTLHLLGASRRGRVGVPGCAGVELGIVPGGLLASAVADSEGVARFTRVIPCAAGGRDLLFQVAELGRCAVSAVVETHFE